MSLFEYLGVLISVVMGLGIAHLLTGISQTIQNRDSVHIYWVQSLWTLNILFYIVAIWWGMFWWSALDHWTFYQFLFILLYAIVLFLLASLLYPWDFPEALSLRKHFYDNRRWFFGTVVVAWSLDIPETLMKQDAGLRDAPQLYLPYALLKIGLAIIAAITKNHRFHAAFAIFWLVLDLLYLGFSSLARIAG